MIGRGNMASYLEVQEKKITMDAGQLLAAKHPPCKTLMMKHEHEKLRGAWMKIFWKTKGRQDLEGYIVAWQNFERLQSDKILEGRSTENEKKQSNCQVEP